MPYGRQGMELTAAGTVSDSHRISFSPLATRVAWGTFCTTKVEMKNELANIFVEFFFEFLRKKKRYDLYHTFNFLLGSVAKPLA